MVVRVGSYKPKVILAFPGCGKSFQTELEPTRYHDLDVGRKASATVDPRALAVAAETIVKEKRKTVFMNVPSVIPYLKVPHMMVLPYAGEKNQWIEMIAERDGAGADELVRAMNKNWDQWLRQWLDFATPDTRLEFITSPGIPEVLHDEGVLLVRSRKGGFYTLPGGFIEGRETPVDAAVRETFEETDGRVKIDTLMLQTIQETRTHSIVHASVLLTPGSYQKLSRGVSLHNAEKDFMTVIPIGTLPDLRRNVEQSLKMGWFLSSNFEGSSSNWCYMDEVNLVFERLTHTVPEDDVDEHLKRRGSRDYKPVDIDTNRKT